MIKRLAFLFVVLPSLVWAQSSPNWPGGYRPSPQEMNAAFAAKQDIGAGTFTSLSQTVNTTWTGAAYPAGTNSAFTSNQTYTGTPTGSGFPYGGGHAVPLNLQFISSDQISWAAGGGTVGWLFKQQFGGGAGAGGRNGVVIDFAQTGPMANVSPSYAALQIFSGAVTGANVTGAAAGTGNGLGDDFAIGATYCGLQTGIFRHECDATEFDLGPAAGSSADYVYGLKFAIFGPASWKGNVFQSFINFQTTNPGVTGLSKYGIYFGDPQAPNGGFPISADGSLISTTTVGTALNGIDFSGITLTGSILKGPASFQIDGSNGVHSDKFWGATSSTVTFVALGGNPTFALVGNPASANYPGVFSAAAGGTPGFTTAGGDATVGMLFKTQTGAGSFDFMNSINNVEFRIAGVAGANSYPVLTPAASGNIQFSVGGTAASIILGTGVALATNATTGDILIPTTAGIPTGFTGAAGQAAVRINTSSHKVCHSEGGGTWYDATGAACS